MKNIYIIINKLNKTNLTDIIFLPLGGLKKLKKVSFWTVLVNVRVEPRCLCFWFFL